MNRMLCSVLRKAAPVTWLAALGAAWWVVPVAFVVVLTGMAAAGTLTGAIAAADEHSRVLLIRELARASREAATSLQPHLRQTRLPGPPPAM